MPRRRSICLEGQRKHAVETGDCLYIASGLSMPSRARARDEFAQRDGGRGEEKRLARGVFFSEDVMAMVEVGKLLCELEGVLGEIGRLGTCNALLQDQGKTAGAQPERPDVFVLFAAQVASKIGDLRG